MKRWRPVDAPPSNGEASLDDWKAHPRLQKHLLRFLHSPDPGRVLSRYSAQAQNSNPEKLLRIAVHVGAWVALLPLGQAAASPSGKEEDVSQPSPVQLLAQILRLRGRAKITDWLQGVLHLVAHRLQDVRSNIQGQAAAPWIELRRSMPKTIWRELRTQRPAIPVCGGSKGQQELAHQGSLLKMQTPPEQSKPAVPRGKVEAEAVLQVSDPGIEALAASDFHFEISELGSKKALRGFYRDGAAFSNANLEERVLHVNGLEEQLVKAVSSESWDQVCSLIREAAATLAAPRQKAALSEPAVPMPEDAQDRLQANLQSKLRRLICRGLGCLDLSDAGTASQLEPALCFMKLLIERFKVRGQLEEARAAKQWMLLQGFITAEATTKAGASLGNSLIEDSCRTDDAFIRKGKVIWSGEDRGSSKDGVYIPGVKVKSNPLVRNTGNDVSLICDKCGIKLWSSWVFEYRGKVHSLVPRHGHNACGGKYVPTDAKLSVKRDNTEHLDMCPHGGALRHCVKCEGSGICVHKKRTSSCPHCLAAGYKKRTQKARTREVKTSRISFVVVGICTTTLMCLKGTPSVVYFPGCV
ncbi:unnamed protein product [Polarella glacialis]|uniref:Uncharacterized protein n=1 Tax=Polarella glacialis TaxID=89957 RepID=A0A813DCW0_POLGL|nr:unnamed protein product [Polarella glacialis]